MPCLWMESESAWQMHSHVRVTDSASESVLEAARKAKRDAKGSTGATSQGAAARRPSEPAAPAANPVVKIFLLPGLCRGAGRGGRSR